MNKDYLERVFLAVGMGVLYHFSPATAFGIFIFFYCSIEWPRVVTK